MAGNSETYSIKTRTKTTTAITAAPMARALSRPPTPAVTGASRGAGAGLPAGAAAADRGAGVGAAGAGAWVAAGATGAATGAADAVGAGAGILMVGAAVGFGGKLIRTVSFLGCTFAASAGLGGTAPDGVFGMFSAINFSEGKLELMPVSVKCLFAINRLGGTGLGSSGKRPRGAAFLVSILARQPGQAWT